MTIAFADLPSVQMSSGCFEGTAGTAHVPFVRDLISVLKPRLIVQIGLDGGAVQQELRATRATQQISLREVDEAVLGSAPNGIELVHLATGVPDEWLEPLLAKVRGVVLFTRITEDASEMAMLWRKVESRFPSFMFPQNGGLGILGIGEVDSGALRFLFTANQQVQTAIRSYYEGCAAKFALPPALATTRSLRSEMEGLRLELRILAGQVNSACDEAEAATAALERTIGELNEVRREYEAEAERRRSMLRSGSWRVTAPLRVLMHLLKTGSFANRPF